MADIRYDIGQIFKMAFGISAPIYLAQPVNLNIGGGRGISYQGVETLPEEAAIDQGKSDFGTPVIYPITLKGGDYRVYNHNGELKDKTFDDFKLPAATLVDFSRAKNITKTNVLGSNGTVKEIYGFDDWRIRIRGVCLVEKDRSPEEQKELLLQWEAIADSLSVKGTPFTEKGIHALVIESIDLKQLQGKPRVIPFEITAVSDEAIELILAQ